MNRFNWRTVLLAAVVVPLFLFFAGSAAAQEAPGTFVSTECTYGGIELGITSVSAEMLGFECGYVVVPERHANPDGPTIRIPVAVRRATEPDAHPDPLFLAQGGPGGDAFEVYSLLAPNTDIAASRDIVVFNQRGTPYATPDLDCPETVDILPEMLRATTEEGEALYNDALAACYARLTAEGVDLSAYNSLENAADVPVLARALGYDEYNFYGVSYGTLLGLHLMRNHPEGLRAVILDSVVSTDVNFLSEIPRSEDRALREVFAYCEADDVCREAYPNLEQRFFDVVRQYDANPVTLRLTDPESGDTHDAYLDGVGVRSLAFQLMYVPQMHAVLPKIVADLERGDLRYIENMWPLLLFDQMLSEGMYYSVICAEDADIDLDALDLDGLRPEIAETARDDVGSIIDACDMWQVEQLPPTVDDPVVSDIPTLLLAGRFDPVTPPAFAEAAAAGLSNSTLLVDPTASHGVAFFSPCVNDIVLDFLNDPQTPPDGLCLQEQELPSAVPPNAITVPLLAGINALEARTLTILGGMLLLLVVVLSPFLVWPVVYLIRAFGADERPERAPEDRRWRRISRVAVLLFGVLSLVFVVGLLAVIFNTIVSDTTLLTALALPPSAAPILWIPTLMLLAAVVVIVAGVMLWRRRGTGSTAGKVYYSLIAAAAVALLVLLATQDLLLPPL